MLKVGNKVKVTVDKKVRVGTVIEDYECFYLVQFPKYKECFNKFAIKNKEVLVEVL